MAFAHELVSLLGDLNLGEVEENKSSWLFDISHGNYRHPGILKFGSSLLTVKYKISYDFFSGDSNFLLHTSVRLPTQNILFFSEICVLI